MSDMMIGFLFSSIFGYISYRKEALSISGVLGAIITGTIIFGFGRGLSWYLLLIIFFVSSSLLSFYRKKDKKEVEAIFEKTGRRDLWQALANGGLASLFALLGYLLESDWTYIGFMASLATVNADTWATELGVLSKRKPRSILTGRLVEKGTSGGVSLFGFFGSFAGSLLIAISAYMFQVLEGRQYVLEVSFTIVIMIVTISGVFGALVDSLIGATIQSMNRCAVCGKETEKNSHCGTKTAHIRGIRILNNDMVNLISSVIASVLAVFMYFTIIN